MAATELKEVKLGFKAERRAKVEQKVNTNCGVVTVNVVGDKNDNRLFPLITLHDFGFNHVTQFGSLEVSGEEASRFFNQFIIYHVDIPGSEVEAGDLAGDYPDIDDLADMIVHIRTSLNISKRCVLLGVGAGANIALRYLVKYSKTVLGAVLVEVTNDSEGWMSWTQNKLTDLVTKPSSLVSFSDRTASEHAYDLLDRHFGRANPPSLILEDFKKYALANMIQSCNVHNMVRYHQAFVARKVVQLDGADTREKPAVLVISGRQSWRNDATVEARSQLHASGHEASLLEPSPCHMFPLEEAPKKCAVAMMLFIQGLGLGLSAGLTSPTTIRETYEDDEEAITRDLSDLTHV